MTVLIVLLVAAVLLWPRAPDLDATDALEGPATAGPRPSRGPRVGRRRGGEEWVAELAELTAVGLHAGLDLPGAAGVAARAPAVLGGAPWLPDRLAAALSAGSGVAACLTEPSVPVDPVRRADLAVLARAWRLSEESGAAASRTTAGAAAAIRARVAARDRVGAALAGPRASMGLLTALPLAGPLVGLLLGVSPAELYGSEAARASAAVGLLLTAAGWWWGRSLVRRALRPGRTDGSP